MIKEIAGKSIELDKDGHLQNRKDWNEDIAVEIAKTEGIEKLTDKHWLVIKFLQQVFEKEGEAPTLRRVNRESGVNTKEFYQLFPKGPLKKAALIAGLPKPKGCI